MSIDELEMNMAEPGNGDAAIAPEPVAADAWPPIAKGDGQESPGVGQRKTNQAKVFQHIDVSRTAAHLSWDSLYYSVNVRKERKEILKGICGDLAPSQLTCILGQSGSGKTSMLNILAGRVGKGGPYSARIGGEVKVNGKVVTPSDYKQLFGYVTEDDALLGTMTPREVLHFAAKLRLSGTKGEKVEPLINDLLELLGLVKCADTMIGNDIIKGISGGEKKRTSVGAELITNPDITFLDEPTSRLDSGAAYDVVAVLKSLTEFRRSVMCTIHQASSEIFHQFDQAIFLVEGVVAYQGPPSGIRDFFGKCGHVCPEYYNPADFVMFIIHRGSAEEVKKITDHARSLEKPASFKVADAEAPADSPPPKSSRKPFCTQLTLLVQREFRNVVRDKALLGARFGSTIFLSLLYSLVFFQIGNKNMEEGILVSRKHYDMQSHAGALTMVGINSMFGAANPLLLTFSFERPVFIRDYASNMYHSVTYFIAKSVVEQPLLALQTLLTMVIVYWSMNLQGNFLVSWLGIFCIANAAASLALVIACLVRHSKQAMEFAPLLFVPQILFAGFFTKIDNIPIFMRWIQYICSLKWGMNILYSNEFDADKYGKPMLEANEVNPDDLWYYFMTLGLIIITLRCCAVVALTRQTKRFYR